MMDVPSWECLPEACFQEVAQHLDLNGLTACRQVSRQWNVITSAAVRAVVFSISNYRLPAEYLHSVIHRARLSFPFFGHIHLKLESRPCTYSDLTVLLEALSSCPQQHHLSALTISSSKGQTLALPLTPLASLRNLRHLHLKTLHNPYALAQLTQHLTNLSSIYFDMQDLTTNPTDHTYSRTLLPLHQSLTKLVAHLSFATSDHTLTTIAQLTNLSSLKLTCCRHFATSAGLLKLSSLQSLTSLQLVNFSFHNIPHEIRAPLAPLSLPLNTHPTTQPPSWHSVWSSLLTSFTSIHSLHLSEINLLPDVLSALAFAPPTLQHLHLTLKYTFNTLPPPASATAALNKIPMVHLELYPHSQHSLERYNGLLGSCTTLHSLRLVGVEMSPYTLKLLQPCRSLHNLHIHFARTPSLAKAPSLDYIHQQPALTAQLLRPLASLTHLAHCHLSGTAAMEPSLLSLAHDADLADVFANLPLASFAVQLLQYNSVPESWDLGAVGKVVGKVSRAGAAAYAGVDALMRTGGSLEEVLFNLPQLALHCTAWH